MLACVMKATLIYVTVELFWNQLLNIGLKQGTRKSKGILSSGIFLVYQAQKLFYLWHIDQVSVLNTSNYLSADNL